MKTLFFNLVLLSFASVCFSPRVSAAEDGPLDLVQALTSFEWQCSSASDPQKDGRILFLLGGKIITVGGELLAWNWQLTGSHSAQIYDPSKNRADQQTLTFNADLTGFTSPGFDGNSPLQGVRLASLNDVAAAASALPASTYVDSTYISNGPVVVGADYWRYRYGRVYVGYERRLHVPAHFHHVLRGPLPQTVVARPVGLKKPVGGAGAGTGRPIGGHAGPKPAPHVYAVRHHR